MKTFIALLPAALLAACATTGPKPVTNEDLLREVRTLRQENQELSGRIDTMSQQPQQVQQPVVQQVQYAPANMTQTVEPPPAQPILPGPPQDWGWFYTPPNGCDSGPFRLAVKNWFKGYYVRLFIDGAELKARGAYGLMTFPAPDGSTMTPIPPRFSGRDPTVVYMCLNHLGEHTLSGIVYGNRAGILVEIGRFSENRTFTADNGSGQGFDLLDELL